MAVNWMARNNASMLPEICFQSIEKLQAQSSTITTSITVRGPWAPGTSVTSISAVLLGPESVFDFNDYFPHWHKSILVVVDHLGTHRTVRAFFVISFASSSTGPYCMHPAMQCFTQAGSRPCFVRGLHRIHSSVGKGR